MGEYGKVCKWRSMNQQSYNQLVAYPFAGASDTMKNKYSWSPKNINWLE